MRELTPLSFETAKNLTTTKWFCACMESRRLFLETADRLHEGYRTCSYLFGLTKNLKIEFFIGELR